MVLESMVFLATLFVIACAILCGLYFMCCHSQQQSDEKRPNKKLLMSDLK